LPGAKVQFHRPEGFTNMWTRVFYANDNDIKYGPMKYEVSTDNVTFVDVNDLSPIQYSESLCTIDNFTNCWYKMIEE
jgi:hypothetical protein